MDQSVRILIIDGSQDDRKKLILGLKKIQTAAYSFVEAKNFTIALDYLNEQIDCVLLSSSLLGKEGLELLEKIRSHYPFLPVILMTKKGEQEISAVAVKKAWDHDFSSALMNPEKLNQVIARLINQRFLQQKDIKEHKQAE